MLTDQHEAPQITVCRADGRRARIIAAARRLFIENGFHSTGVAQIARESGVAVGQLYRDFASKEAIIAQIVLDDSVRFMLRGDLERCIASGNEEAVWYWLRTLLEPGPERDDVLIVEIMAEASRNPKIKAIFEANHASVRSGPLRAIEVLMPGEALAAERETMADMVMMLSLGLLQYEAMRGKDEARRLAQATLASLKTQIAAIVASSKG